MDIAIAPASGVSSAQTGTGQPVAGRMLTPGEIVDAKVLQILSDGRARLALADTVLDVATQVKLIAGATIRLAVSASETGLKLAIVEQVAPPTGAVVSTAGQPGTAGPATPQAGVPGSAAPVAAADPATVKPSINLIPNAAAAPAVVAAAAADRLASHPHSNSPLPPPLPQAAAPAAAAAAALSSAVQASAARQSGLSPLFADAAVAANLATLPEPVRRAIQQLLALRPALDETLSADTVKQAFQRSGLFLEARLAAAATGSQPAALPMVDLKAVLTVMRDALGNWLDPDGASSPPAAPPAAAGDAKPSPSAAAPPALPPPYRGGAPVAQPAVPASIAPDTAPETVGRALIAEVDGVLSRQTLLQAASLPDPGATMSRPDAARWNFEVPFALPQGTTVGQFEIARDGGGGDTEKSAQPVWRVRFCIDVEPIGPVHAQVALIGGRAAVTLWAERPDTSMRLRDHSGRLAEALRAAAFETSEVLVRDGTPPRPNQPALSGRFLDRAS